MGRSVLAKAVIPSAIVACWAMMLVVLCFLPSAWPLLMLAAWSLLGALVLATLVPGWQLFGPIVARIPGRPGMVALTFDDGPHPSHTRAILDALEAAGARGTFFLVGHAVERFPDLAREILVRGHQVAQHGFQHRWQLIFSPRKLADDFARAVRAVQLATGRAPRWYRPPFGIATPEILDVVRPAFRLAGWAVRPFDGGTPDADEVRRRVASKIQAGDIVLLHDAARDERSEPPAVRALPGILRDLGARGLRSVTLAELACEPAYLEDLPVPHPPRRRRSPIPGWVAWTVAAMVACSSACAFGAEPDSAGLPATLVAAASELGKATTVQARFRQTRTSILFVDPVVQEGTLLLRRTDGRLLWIYDDGPAVLMAGGRFHPVGSPDEPAGEGATSFGMPGGGDLVALFEGLFVLDPAILGRYFVGRDLGDGRFELKPRQQSAAALFSLVTLEVGGSPLAVRRVQMDEPTGDRTEIAFSEVRTGEPIPDERLRTPAEREAAGGRR